MQVLTTPAVVLRAVDYGESDRIVTFLTRDAGKVSGIAKGAKRSQRRFPGALGLFSLVSLHYRTRPGAELVFLERAQLLVPWRSLLDSLERYAAASHVVEVADKMTAEQEVGDDLFHVVVAALGRIDRSEPGPATLRLFELATLAVCGYRAELQRCVRCRQPLGTAPSAARLAPAAGGAACGRCADPEEAGAAISPAALHCLGRMQVEVARATASARRDAEGLFAAEAELAATLPRAVTRELGAALAALLAPRVRGRLLSAELLGPVVGRGLVGA
ncbi:MAG: DNA repair protein RecO [Alphaproteobacteria bacterium]